MLYARNYDDNINGLDGWIFNDFMRFLLSVQFHKFFKFNPRVLLFIRPFLKAFIRFFNLNLKP